MANNTEQKIIQDTIKSFFNDFNKQTINITLESNNALLEKISAYFVDRLNPNSENSFNKKTTVDELTSDIKKTTYYNIKNIYDKICGVNDEQSTGDYLIQKIEDLNKINVETLGKQRLFYNLKFSSEECFGEGENQNIVDYDLYQIFQIVDRGNNDIGTKVLADLGYLYDNLYAEFDSQPIAGQPDKNITVNNLTKGSFQKLFSGLATQSGFLFQQIPNYLNLNSAISGGNEEFINNVVDDLFGVHQTTNLAGAEIFKNKNNTQFGGLFGLPGYIFQLGTTTSSTDNQEKVQVNDYTNSFCLDIGLDKNNEINIIGEDIPHEIKNSNITCFAVDFATQKQQMFNNIQLDTNEFYDTEESIRTWVDAVNSTDQYLQTTNLFPVLEKRSYTCTVSGLGNATIQPLSYFYLRNVPLFHGTYWITNVSHKINQNTMSTTFKGVRQPIISKQDVRKQLLELMRKKADALLKASDTANKVITEGISDTEGDIKQIDNSDKQYGAIIQQRKDDNGYQEFDAKTLIGSFIYSITNSNDDKDANNLGIIATLYNQAKSYIGSEEHAKIIKNIKNIVVGKIKIAANDDDKRYCQTKSEPSLSVLYKNSGYSNIGKLSSLLDDILNESDYNRLIKLPKNIKLYGLTNTNDTQIQLQLGSEITTVKSENVPINEATIYLDHNPGFAIKSNTPFAGSDYNSKSLTANDILISLSGNTINVSKQVNEVPIKYLGTFTLSKNVSFYSVNNGNISFSDTTKKTYDVDIATTDDLNQLSGDPNKDIKLVNDGAFTAKLKYPDLLSEVVRGESKDYDDYNWYKVNADKTTSRAQKQLPGLSKRLTQYTIKEIQNLQYADSTQEVRRNNNRLFATGRYQIITQTLKGLVDQSKIDTNQLYSPEIQDGFANLIVEGRSNLINYINGKFEDTDTTLNAAALEVAKEWASAGVPYSLNADKGRFVNKDQSYYSGTGNNKAFISSDTIKAVLKKERQLFGQSNRTSGQPITQSTTNNTTNKVNLSKSITIGDSISVGVHGAYTNIELIKNPVLSTVGWRITDLITALKNVKDDYKSVKNLVLSLGSNDGWSLSLNNNKEKELIAIIKSKFPNADLHILNGNYGWGSLKVQGSNTAVYWEGKINTYINFYKNDGFKVIGNVTQLTVHPANGDALFNSFKGILSKLN
jgi:hypothetical protein